MNRKLFVKLILASLILLKTTKCFSAESYITGNISNLTSVTVGLLVMVDSGLPGNCAGTAFGWMLIRAENKHMIALLLTMYASGKRAATIYTNGITTTGYCEINQYDPIE